MSPNNKYLGSTVSLLVCQLLFLCAVSQEGAHRGPQGTTHGQSIESMTIIILCITHNVDRELIFLLRI